MNTSERANGRVKITWLVANQKMQLEVLPRNIGGKLVPGFKGIVDRQLVSRENNENFWAHGVEARVGDSCAVARADKDGKTRPEMDVHLEMCARPKRMIDFYNSGAKEWEVPREGGGVRIDGLLIEAVMELRKKSRETVIEALSKLTAQQRNALAGDKMVAPVIARLEQEQAQRVGINTEELLAGI